MREQTIDHTTPEALANLPLERLAGLCADLISDMACIEIALTHPMCDVDASEQLHPDADCYETVGAVRAMRRERDRLAAELDRTQRRTLRLERELRAAMHLMSLGTNARAAWMRDASAVLSEEAVNAQ